MVLCYNIDNKSCHWYARTKDIRFERMFIFRNSQLFIILHQMVSVRDLLLTVKCKTFLRAVGFYFIDGSGDPLAKDHGGEFFTVRSSCIFSGSCRVYLLPETENERCFTVCLQCNYLLCGCLLYPRKNTKVLCIITEGRGYS